MKPNNLKCKGVVRHDINHNQTQTKHDSTKINVSYIFNYIKANIQIPFELFRIS